MSARRGLPALAFLVAVGLGLASGQPPSTNPNERYVKDDNPVMEAEASKGGTLWVLDFKFKDPRLIKVNIPGRGQRVCWYLWYQVINRTGAPRTFIPDFELGTTDTNMVYRDQILPTVEEAIRKIEDPTNFYKIKNSVTIAADPIPVTLPKAALRPITGVAIWTDPNEPNPDDDAATRARKEKLPKLADSNNYSIFVAGLSNGWSLTDTTSGDKDKKEQVVRRKTLRLKFRRFGDKYLMKSEAIKFQPPEIWEYRATSLTLKMPATGK